MRVKFTVKAPEVPLSEAGFVVPSQVFLTLMKEYEVHGVSVYKGVTFVLLIDDTNTPAFFHRAYVEVVDSEVPNDWICNVFPDDPVQCVLGPSFMAKDLESYEGVVDLQATQMELFWNRGVGMKKKDSATQD